MKNSVNWYAQDDLDVCIGRLSELKWFGTVFPGLISVHSCEPCRDIRSELVQLRELSRVKIVFKGNACMYLQDASLYDDKVFAMNWAIVNKIPGSIVSVELEFPIGLGSSDGCIDTYRVYVQPERLWDTLRRLDEKGWLSN